ncbi:hypothetical protein ACZ90_00235 [Streptomyces albus subsp. albus]|nr:hypothetical protein ACZ90_00235 [Streptomyces albus subsp. albus]
MSDIHQLPLMGHDLPAPRARVYRQGGLWWWEHACPTRGIAVAFGDPRPAWSDAYGDAIEHLRGCL